MLKHATWFKIYAARIAIAMVLVLCGYVPVSATPILNFDQDSGGGTISYDGEGGALIGSDIVFETVVGLGTSLNNGVILNITDGYLNFTTGDILTEGPSTWTFGDGGSFVLTGTAKTSGGTTIATGTLLEGYFTADPANPSVTGNGSVLVATSFGVDTKNQALLDYYGVTSSDFQFVNTEISMEDITIDADNGFSGTVTVFLLGSACLVGFSGLRRKFKK